MKVTDRVPCHWHTCECGTELLCVDEQPGHHTVCQLCQRIEKAGADIKQGIMAWVERMEAHMEGK